MPGVVHFVVHLRRRKLTSRRPPIESSQLGSTFSSRRWRRACRVTSQCYKEHSLQTCIWRYLDRLNSHKPWAVACLMSYYSSCWAGGVAASPIGGVRVPRHPGSSVIALSVDGAQSNKSGIAAVTPTTPRPWVIGTGPATSWMRGRPAATAAGR